MNDGFRIGLALSVTVLSGGCMFGELGIYGQEREDYLKSIKHYIEYWDKPGMTVTERMQDWIECGGRSDGNFVPALIRRPLVIGGLTQAAAWDKLQENLEECMHKKGYTSN
jgi:hypothetical protein